MNEMTLIDNLRRELNRVGTYREADVRATERVLLKARKQGWQVARYEQPHLAGTRVTLDAHSPRGVQLSAELDSGPAGSFGSLYVVREGVRRILARNTCGIPSGDPELLPVLSALTDFRLPL